MRVFFIGILTFILPFSIYSQNQEYTIKCDNCLLSDIVSEVEKKYQIKFSYNPKELAEFRKSVSISTSKKSILIKNIFDDLPFKIKEVKNVYLIIPQKPKKWENKFIKGKIYDKESGEPLAFAHIVGKGNTTGTVTNINGGVTFPVDEQNDKQEFIISHIGYKSELLTTEFNHASTPLNINLNKDLETLQPFLITNNEIDDNHINISKFEINPSQISSLPFLGENDVLKSSQLLAGISSTNETNAGMYVRGGKVDQNLILIDGINIYQSYHFLGAFSTLNPFIIENLQIQKGAFDAKYGGRVSSIVTARMKKSPMNSKSIHGGININNISVNTYIEAPISNKLSTIVSFRKSLQYSYNQSGYNNFIRQNRLNKIDDFNSRLYSDFMKVEPKINFFDLTGKLSYRPNEKSIVDLNFFLVGNSYDSEFINYDNIGNYYIYDYIDRFNTGLGINWINYKNDAFNYNVSLAYSGSSLNSDLNISENFANPLDLGKLKESKHFQKKNNQLIIEENQKTNSVDDITLKIEGNKLISANQSFEFGAEFNYYNTYLDFSLVPIIQEKRNQQALLVSVFGQYNFIYNRFNFNLGLRNSYYEPTQDYLLEPRIKIDYHLNNNITLKGSFSRHNQFLNELPLEDNIYSSSYWVLADGEEDNIITSNQFVLGATFNNTDWNIDVELYRKYNFNIMEYQQFFILMDDFLKYKNDSYSNYFLYGDNIINGIDVMVKRKFKYYSTWLAYSYIDSKNFFEELDFKPYTSNLVSKHELNWVNIFKIKTWEFSTTFILASGKPYTKLNKDILDEDLEDININTSRLPAYHRLDVSAKKNFKFKRLPKLNFEAGITLFNIYDYRPTKSIDYKFSYDEKSFHNEKDDDDYSLFLNKSYNLGFSSNFFFNMRF